MTHRSSRTTHSHRAEPDPRTLRRWQLAGTVVGAVLMLTAGLGVAAAETGGTAAPAVRCPLVADRLPPVPADAQPEVVRNLVLLNLQVTEANQRLASSQGRGGPEFVTTAILQPLAEKRRATIDEIVVEIGRHAPRPVGLEALAACRVTPGGAGAAPEPTVLPPAAPSGGAPTGS